MDVLQLPPNMISLPIGIKESQQKKVEEDLREKVKGFLLLESDLPFNALSSKHVELLLHCRSSNDIGDILRKSAGSTTHILTQH